jgi:hypothetical protein
MAATEIATRVCETPGCDKEAKLQCPTCIKLMIQGSFFCSQVLECSLWFGFYFKLKKYQCNALKCHINWDIIMIKLHYFKPGRHE